jgi:serine/threonine protein kinase
MVARPAPNWHVKLADFGICRRLKLSAFRRDMDGTASYVAPECCYVAYHLGDRPHMEDNQPEYSTANDVWALGGVAYMVRAGEPPFWSGEAVNAYLAEPAAKFPTDRLRGASEACVDFIRRAMVGSPGARPTVAALLGDAWLAGFENLDGSVLDG